jgi:hypothetical protein
MSEQAPERVWLPDSVILLAAVSPELENIEGAYWIRETNKTCLWKEDPDDVWETACGELFQLNDGAPSANNLKFCCYCGRKLEERRYSYENDY